MFRVRELFYSIQGEGRWSGRPAVFVRFAGCNLWSGLEKDRASAVCRFCDTDFVGGDRYGSAEELAQAAWGLWPGGGFPMVVLTGGEPTLQVTSELVEHLRGFFFVAMESNGTRAGPEVDWLTVSPKAGAPLAVEGGDELKLVWPQAGIDTERLEALDFTGWYIQPMAGEAGSTQTAADFVLRNPRWRLSLQAHKYAGLR